MWNNSVHSKKKVKWHNYYLNSFRYWNVNNYKNWYFYIIHIDIIFKNGVNTVIAGQMENGNVLNDRSIS